MEDVARIARESENTVTCNYFTIASKFVFVSHFNTVTLACNKKKSLDIIKIQTQCQVYINSDSSAH